MGFRPGAAASGFACFRRIGIIAPYRPDEINGCIYGSAQEFDGTRILCRFPENYGFGSAGGRWPSLPSTVALLAPTASEVETLSPWASHRPSHWGLQGECHT
jgi:hypothetical protein